MLENESSREKDGLRTVIEALDSYDQETRARIIRTAQTFFGIDSGAQDVHRTPADTGRRPTAPRDLAFTDRPSRPSLSPKEFMREKQPKTDIERVACLAYYLAHYRDTPYFKTLDISKLNTEAAQIKFSNPAFSVVNTTNTGYLTGVGKGNKQLTSHGEELVNALPDREKAKAAVASQHRRKPRRRAKNAKN